ncbi:hypothetical protein BZA77DRAFT_335121 [Pyronema omphalodes]|nr:hypothetical protein BZA77DRAFT_335121 [Pyronema omphalodes]
MGQQEGDELDKELADAEIAGEDSGFDDDEMDKMSSSPSIADEDIDFEMVYALHHFNATVEGQANAAKGEHMVLLDDSNSYWWLVRIVRDSSIGYLPAEHIETPTERLARLNKHRNIDLAANMLSDTTPEKSRNPLKKIRARRNTKKTVAFTDPIYHEASEYEYSDEEEEGAEGPEGEEQEEGNTADATKLEPTQDPATNEDLGADPVAREKPQQSVNVITPPTDPRVSNELQRKTSNESEQGVKLRANPTPAGLRHPDSAIFNDENHGTKKLTLTPNLLRDDGVSAPPTKPEVIKGRGSMDREKTAMKTREESVISPPPNSKGRMKKGGVLGNLFKKRNKKGKKEEEDELEDWLHSGTEKSSEQKMSLDSSRSSESKDSPGVRSDEGRKEREEAMLREEQRKQQEVLRARMEQEAREAAQKKAQVAVSTSSSIRRVESADSATAGTPVTGPAPGAIGSPGPAVGPAAIASPPPAQTQPKASPLDTVSLPSALRVAPPEQVKPRSPAPTTAIDTQIADHYRYGQRRPSESDTPSSINKPAYSPQTYQPYPSTSSTITSPTKSSSAFTTPRNFDRLSESPEEISFHDAAERNDPLDNSSGPESPEPHSPATSATSEQEIEIIHRSNTFDTAVTSPDSGAEMNSINGDMLHPGHTITRSWSDWSLRTYFEDDNDVRDMLIVVQQDKGETKKPGNPHPEIAPLFAPSSRKLADLTKQLDGMLGDWLQRRSTRSTKA